ncbi:MAG: AAA family ATPase [bacterium]
MRIRQIDLDGYGGLSGSFSFPTDELGLWCAPNESGKSQLAAAICAALYGEVPVPGRAMPSGWLMLRLETDDDRSLVVARDLEDGSVQVTDASGEDVSEEFVSDDANEIGEILLGLTREEFREITCHDLPALATTVGNETLRSLLTRGRGCVRFSTPRPPSRDAIPAPRTATAAKNVEPTFRATHEAPADVVEDENPVETAPTSGPDAIDRLRDLKRRLEQVEAEFDRATDEYRRSDTHRQELQAEAERLQTLSGAEPGDVEKLDSLLALLDKIQGRRRKLRAEEEEFRRELATRDVNAENIEALETEFAAYSEDDRRFLGGYRQFETILRGNQALVRSESRLDDSRLAELDQARASAMRLASIPLGVAILALAGAILAQIFPALPVPALAFIAIATIAGAGGGYLFYRAKNLREDERDALLETAERKQLQMDMFAQEEEEATQRLAELAEARKMESPTELVDRYQLWAKAKGDIRQLESYTRRGGEIDRELVTLREKLASFAPSENPDIDPEQLAERLADYRRFFELNQDLARAEDTATAHEEKLAELEQVRNDCREEIAAALTAEGVDADSDLDEAIERYARRVADRGDGTTAVRATRPEAPPAAPEPREIAGPREIQLTDEPAEAPAEPVEVAASAPDPFVPESATTAEPEVDDRWRFKVSARAEEIARRLLPEVRELDVDEGLEPRVRFSESGPLVPWSELQPHLSSAVTDQLCLALRLAIVETVCSVGERVPVLLDDPLLRADDDRHSRAMQFLVEDARSRGQIALLTAHEVRTRWFLHRHPKLKDRVRSLRGEGFLAASPSPSRF